MELVDYNRYQVQLIKSGIDIFAKTSINNKTLSEVFGMIRQEPKETFLFHANLIITKIKRRKK